MAKQGIVTGLILFFLFNTAWGENTLATDKETPGMVLSFSFNEGEGKIVKDNSGFDNDGVIDGATWVDGVVSKALKLDGKSYVKINPNEVLDITDELSFEAWVYCLNIPPEPHRQSWIFSKCKAWNEGWEILFQNDKTGGHPNLLVFGIGDGSEVSNVGYYGGLPLKKWTHIVAVVKSGEYMKLYVDGQVVDSKTTNVRIASTDEPLFIGRWDNWGFNGIIDELKIHRRVLSEKEIKDKFEEVNIKIESETEKKPDALNAKILTNRFWNLFHVDEPIPLQIEVFNIDKQVRKVELVYEIKDYYADILKTERLNFELEPNSVKTLPIQIKPKKMGPYLVSVKITSDNFSKEFQGGFATISPCEPSEDSPFGIQAFQNPTGLGWENDPERGEETSRVMESMGIKWQRLMLPWNMLQGGRGEENVPVVFDWKTTPFGIYGIETLLKHNVNILGLLFGSPPWVSESFCEMKPEYIKDFENYVYQVVNQYKKDIKIWDVWNEPDGGGVEIDVYVEMLKGAYRAAKRADPACRILGVSLAGAADNNYRYLREIYKKGGWDYFDIIGIHPYSRPSAVGPGISLGPVESGLVAKIDTLKEILKEYGDKEIWIDEIGLNFSVMGGTFPFDIYEKEHAEFLVKTYILSISNGVKKIIWYEFGPAPSKPPGDRCGIFEETDCGNIRPRPAVAAYSTVSSFLTNATFIKRIDLGSDYLYGYLFQKRKEFIISLWSSKEEKLVEMPSFKGMEIYDIMGNPVQFQGEGNKVNLKLTGSPIFLTFKMEENQKPIEFLRKKEDEKVKLEISIPDISTIMVEVKNYSNHKVSGKLRLNLPEEWISNIEEIEFKLPEKTNKTVYFKVSNNSPPGKKRIEVIASINGEVISKNLWVDFILCPEVNRPITIDGDLEEWKGQIPIRVDKLTQVFPPESALQLQYWKGPQDLSGNAYVMWDKDNFYFACEVEDDVFSQDYLGGDTWQADNIQLAIDTLNDGKSKVIGYDENDYEYGLTLTPKGPQVYRSIASTDKKSGLVNIAKLAVKREKGITIYEAAIPIEELSPLVAKAGKIIGFSFIINDEDENGKGRKWIGLTPGIGESKIPTYYKDLVFESIKQ